MRRPVAGGARFAATLLLALSAAACAHAPGGGRDQVLALDRGQAGLLDGGGRIVFANVVNDSRCPRGATCIWAGTATAHLQLVLDPQSGDTVSVLAVLPGGVLRQDVGAQLPVDTLGMRITLLELLPYPEAGAERAVVRPRAIVRVSPSPRPGR
ncbi:MAG: hypothetical protein ABI960_04415 [Candidatus Eisenbacteria bacterium]